MAREIRRVYRKRILRKGAIVLPDGREPALVRITDLSARGAQLQLLTPRKLTRAFHLIDLADELVYGCTLQYRAGALCGLQFRSRFSLDGLPSNLSHLRDIAQGLLRPAAATVAPDPVT